MSRPSLEEGLRASRVLVCAGTGGVGKTTIAAALGLQAALQGRRTLVLTIDPARRLADALGLESLGSTPTAVELPLDESWVANPAAGTLHAMMLDPKPTFDRLVTRLTQDEAILSRILDNRIYRHLSEALAGSAEYAAMEQVHEMVESGRYDLVIVDTPPSSHALDFLRAPRRLREFLESRFVRALVRPAMSASRLGMRFFARPLHHVFNLLDRIAGAGFLDELTEFLSAIDGLSDGFRERATRIEQILLGKHTNFLLICGAASGSEPGTLEFLDELDELGVCLAAVIVNRVRPWPIDQDAREWLERATEEGLARDAESLCAAFEAIPDSRCNESKGEATRLAADLIATVREAAHACECADRTLEVLRRRVALRRLECHSVPEFADDVDRIEGLLEIGRALTGTTLAPQTSSAEASD